MTKQGKYNNPLQATINGIFDLYGKKTATVQLPEQLDLKGKTVMIIGASSGLGLATAQKIASAGSNLIMAMRSGIPDKGEKIKNISGNDQIIMYHVDLLDFNSINKFLDHLVKDSIKIDILISNAAMVPLKSRKSPQGLEEMFMVNYLSAFYLINQLINRNIIQTIGSVKSRIIIVSSESHRNPEDYDWDNFGKFEAYSIKETVSRYGYFKLLLTTFANALSHRLHQANTNIDVRVLCPGPVNSNIAREAPALMKPLLKLVFSIFFKSPEKACDPILFFATQESKTGLPIEYFFLMQPKDMDAKATIIANGQKLWQVSENLINALGYKLNP